MFYYYDDKGIVKMVSEGQIETILNEVEINDSDFENYSMIYEDETLKKISK